MNFVNIVIDSPLKMMYLIDNIIVGICFIAVVIAVLIDFVEYHGRNQKKKEKKSIVETGTMFLFFFLFYSFMKFDIGRIKFDFNYLILMVNVIGLAIIIVGSIVNVKGRFKLGKNWSNQIKIYKDHKFISTGVYSIVRHPLYASIIWMFLAASIVYSNYLSLLSTILIFIPFMYYRARQEEFLLAKEFENYKSYQRGVGMFFPKKLWHSK